ncbi:MAG: hypothetical protein ACUVTU_10985 [Desulfurispora sp.]|uniref:hypothetical protein n=1 Tax=Desulfurispora sp. TaxID=3014275 RepID=UPI00404A1897
MEDVLGQILSCVQDIKAGQERMEKRLTALEQRVVSLENCIISLEKRVVSLEERVVSLEERVVSLEKRVVSLEERVISLEERVVSLEAGQKDLQGDIQELTRRVDKLELRLENQITEKIRALFDGYSLRGDQILKLQQQMHERLLAIAEDVNFLVGRSARHDMAILKLEQRI